MPGHGYSRRWVNRLIGVGILSGAVLLLAGAVVFLHLSSTPAGRYERYASGGRFIGASPAISPDGASIVYASPETGHGDVYRIRIDDSYRTRLTDDPDYEGDPAISPDGRTIAFVREQAGVGHIWLMDADGSNPRRLTAGRYYDEGPAFSPDGQTIVFTRRLFDWTYVSHAACAELFTIRTDGTQLTRLTSNTRPDWEATFSPDGTSIVYSVGSEELWLMQKDGSNPQAIGSGASPAYAPDGKTLVHIGGQYGRVIDLMQIDGSKPRTLFLSDTYKSTPRFVPDGSRILFLDEPRSDGMGKLTILSLDGKVLQVVGEIP